MCHTLGYTILPTRMMSDKLGVSTGAVLELAIREKARREEVVLPPKTATAKIG